MASDVCVYLGDELAAYGFPEGHPFGTDRQEAFWNEALRQGLNEAIVEALPVMAGRPELELFHTSEYVEKVMTLSELGYGYLDYGDTPAFPGVFEAASHVAGSALDGLKRIMEGRCRMMFQPIGGLHHARRHSAAGFCVFNDIAVVIEALRNDYGISRVAYVDIDVHHGDGVFYSYEDDPELAFVDLHEDGNYLYPGTGHAHETGKGEAQGTKMNVPMPPGAGDREFFMVWEYVEKFLKSANPEFVLFQCGADSLAGDPLAHLRYTPAAHAHAARSLRRIAEDCCEGRMIAFGGGGYNRKNLALAWCAVLRELASPE
ncbi:MAG: acetoin utilization protein AcuC [Betaproteobacteria bacterium]|nr:acetoin utilization protein AcuC [Betaproteobacteria bacterium]